MESPPARGIYFLPSLFTTAGLFFGFFAIISATRGHFDSAAVGLLIAMVMDGLDGRIARMTNTTSEFGKEYDSLVDVIAFGLAPSLVIYFFALQYLGKTGWLVSFIYAAAAALRLARFNTISGDKRYFVGLPSPSAAAFVVFWVWSLHDFELTGVAIPWLSALIAVIAAVLMVSNVKFRSFKDMDVKRRVPFMVLMGVVLVFVLVYFDPPRVLFLMAAIYALSGPVSWTLKYRRGEEKLESLLDDDMGEAEAEEHIERVQRSMKRSETSDEQ